MLIFLRNMLQLILSPTRGWEDISMCHTEPRKLLSAGLYPLMTFAALSVFLRLVYGESPGWIALVEHTTVIFVSIFVSYFFAHVMFKTFFYRYTDTAPNERKYTTVIIYCISLLSLSIIIYNALPVRIGLEYLLPLAVAMILWKAETYLAVASDKSYSFIFFGFMTVIAPSWLLQYLFNMIL